MAKRNNTKLTQKGVDGYKAKDKAYRVFDETVTGLCLYVGKSGSKTWYLYYTDRNNKRQSFRMGSVQQYNVVDARTEARKQLGKIASGQDPALKKRKKKQVAKSAQARTLRKYLEGGYWTHYLSKQKSGLATQKRIQASYSDYLDMDMATITSDSLTAHRTKRFDKGVSPQTLNRDRMALHTLFVKAIKAGLITSNPASKEFHEPLETVDDERVRYLGQRDEVENKSEGERERFILALKTLTPNVQAIIGLAMNTGCRRGELFNLTWDNVSMKNQTLTVTAHSAKTSKKRVIPLNNKAVEILTKWRGGNNVLHLDGLVFPSDTKDAKGKPKKLNNIKRQWTNLMRRADIIDFRFHDLRHDFASRLVMNRVSLYEVRDLLGHSSITMTERYSHLADEQLRNAVDML